VRAHFGATVIAFMITLARLVAYAIDNRERWRRFMFLVLLALAVAMGWWMLVGGGIHVLLHDFGRT
jgi:uncharacterized membrane protein YqjE